LKPKKDIGPEKTALILKFGQIGDVIMAIPAARALYDKGFEIHWVCGRAVQPLLESYSWIRLVPTNDKELLLGSPFQRVILLCRLWSKIAFRRFDLCATLYYDWRYRLLTLPVWARRKVSLSWHQRNTMLVPGRDHTDEFARILLSLEDTCREQSVAPVRPDILPPSPLPPKTAPTRVALVPGGASQLIREQYIRRSSPENLRRWPIERYLELAKRLRDRNWEVVLIGGPEDGWVSSYFHDLSVTDLIGTLSLPQVIAFCNACDAVISHDTGPLHLAGLSNTCLIGLFGPTDPATRIPRRPLAVGIWGGQGFACRPCFDGRSFAPCNSNGCMRQISSELVLRELDRLLDARSQGESTAWAVILPEMPGSS
jgi:heptosyltransferase-2